MSTCGDVYKYSELQPTSGAVMMYSPLEEVLWMLKAVGVLGHMR